MKDNFLAKTYTLILQEQQGRGLSEAHVQEILRQVITQLDRMHEQGQAHGAISLETLMQRESQVILAPSPQVLSANPQNVHEDIYMLGVSAIELLTGKTPNLSRYPDGRWVWEDECCLTERLKEAILKMIDERIPNHFNSASQVLSTISSSSIQRLDRTKIKIKLSLKLILIFVFSLIFVVGLPSFFDQGTKAKQSEAKTILSGLNLAQGFFYKENSYFSDSLQKLSFSYPPSRSYEYKIDIFDGSIAIATATAKNKKLKSYSSTVLYIKSSEQFVSEICETNEPSVAAPKPPMAIGSTLQCPSNSKPLNANINQNIFLNQNR